MNCMVVIGIRRLYKIKPVRWYWIAVLENVVCGIALLSSVIVYMQFILRDRVKGWIFI